jgi:hypothetical protein
MVCKNIPKDQNTSKTLPVVPKKATSLPPPKGSEESGCLTPVAPLPPYLVAISYYLLQPDPVGRGSHLERIDAPFRLSKGIWAALLMTHTGTFKPLLLLSRLLNRLG